MSEHAFFSKKSKMAATIFFKIAEKSKKNFLIYLVIYFVFQVIITFYYQFSKNYYLELQDLLPFEERIISNCAIFLGFNRFI